MTYHYRLIGLDPTPHGCGFAVFEGPERLLDWGHASIRPANNAVCLERVAGLMARYEPHVVALEDIHHPRSRRRKRIQHLITSISEYAYACNAHVEFVSWSEVKRTLSVSKQANRRDVAEYIASLYPEVAPLVPPPRKVWMSEFECINVFDAMAFSLTAFTKDGGPVIR
jgi:Holliday junction resolvasome RuvABC endonuclease subunit